MQSILYQKPYAILLAFVVSVSWLEASLQLRLECCMCYQQLTLLVKEQGVSTRYQTQSKRMQTNIGCSTLDSSNLASMSLLAIKSLVFKHGWHHLAANTPPIIEIMPFLRPATVCH